MISNKDMMIERFPLLISLIEKGSGLTGRWKLWAMFAVFALVSSIGTWITGQYQIGRLDSLKDRYDEPITNYAKYYGDSLDNSLERDLLEGCKQAQIGTWLQTTDALRFDGPLTGNRVGVRLDIARAYIDLSGAEISGCIRDEVEDRQFDIGSLTNTWSIILLLIAICLGVWSWICRHNYVEQKKGRNIYAETLAENALIEPEPTLEEDTPEPPPEQKS
jgi:hypothetical protein